MNYKKPIEISLIIIAFVSIVEILGLTIRNALFIGDEFYGWILIAIILIFYIYNKKDVNYLVKNFITNNNLKLFKNDSDKNKLHVKLLSIFFGIIITVLLYFNLLIGLGIPDSLAILFWLQILIGIFLSLLLLFIIPFIYNKHVKRLLIITSILYIISWFILYYLYIV